MASAMATTIATAVNTMARPRTIRSLSFGTSAITSAPTRGRNVAIEIADSSQAFIGTPSVRSSDPREDDGQDHHAGEQECRVALDVAGLQVPQQTPGEPDRLPEAVHGPVDDLLVEGLHPPREQPCDPRGTVHGAVEDVLVRPVDERGHGVPDRTDDAAPVDLVEVVLLREQRVHGAEHHDRISFLPAPVDRPPTEE